MPLIEEAHKAARILLDHAYVRIVARASPDAICASALLTHALRRENVDFHVSWTRRLDEARLQTLAEERSDCTVLIGLGGDAARPESGAVRTIVMDAGPMTLQGDALVHDDAALSSLAHLVAAGISRRNVDLAPLALAGVIGSMRHIGGFRGLDAEILREAIEARILLREPSLGLEGTTLHAALAQLSAPYIAGITGRARNVKKLLTDMDLAGEMPPSSVKLPDAERIGDFLALRLLQQGAPDASLDALYRPVLRALNGPHMGLESGDTAHLAEAACIADRCGLAFAALWPDAAAAGEAGDLVTGAREALVQALVAAERDAKTEGRLIIAEAPSATLCRPLVDRLALSRGPPGALLVAHAPDGDGTYLALRSFGGHNAGEIARKVAPLAGAITAGNASEAHLFAPDATRALKSLAEALS